MPAPIKVLPVDASAVGLVHPVDGPLSEAGSLWSYDTFTVRHLDAGVIRRFEAEAVVPAPAPKAAGAAPATAAAPAAAAALRRRLRSGAETATKCRGCSRSKRILG